MTLEPSLGQLKIAATQRPDAAAYWRQRLAAGPDASGFPSDLSPPSRTRSRGVVIRSLRVDLVDALERLSRRSNQALHVVLAAGLAGLLRVYSGNDEVTLGQPVPADDADLLTPLLVLRCPVTADDSARELILRMRGTVQEALAHRDFPLSVIAGELGFTVDPMVEVAIELAGLHDPGFAEAVRVPMLFSFVRTTGKLTLTVRYDVARYLPSTVERIVEHYLLLLTQVAADPQRRLGDISIMTDDDAVLLAGMNATGVRFDTQLRLDEVFARRAARQPDATALVGTGGRWSYTELDRRANQLAHTLRERGVGPGDVVAVLAERSPEMMVAILAVLKAGGAYLPIDPGYPPARTAYVIDDSQAKLALTQPRFAAGLTAATVLNLHDEASYAARTDAPALIGGAGDLAYVIYTSGSTGNPKGVMIEHRSVINRISWMQKEYPIDSSDVILQKTPIAFDVSVWELFWWMFVGGSLCLLEPGGEKNPDAIAEAVATYQVTTMHFVPSMLTVFLDYVEATGARDRLAALRQVFASGEALGAHTVRHFRRLLTAPFETRLVNLYGPTEATVDVSHFPCDADVERVPIGWPIDNIRLYVTDDQLRVQPAGVPGELCIAGVGLARGYLHRPELTVEKFVPHPFAGEERAYRTGDLARWLPNGTVEYLGRIDHQVKIRGYRIELGEIEERLRVHPGVGEAVVVARDGVEGDRYLCGYVVPREYIDPAALREFLAQALPDYMVPAHLVSLEKFPLAPNGKLDRRALPEPSAAPAEPVGYVAPGDERAAALAGIWAEVLGVERVGIRDNFFALGGNSIHFVSVLARIRALGMSVTFQQLFAHPTIAELLANTGPALSPQEELDARQEFAPFELVCPADRAKLPVDAEDAYPMALLQTGLIYQSEITGGTAQYHDVMSYLIRNRFEAKMFEAAVRILVQQYPMMRTTYHLTGYLENLQIVHADVPLPLAIVDLRGLDEARQGEWHADWVAREQARRFRWEEPGLVRLHVQILRDDLYRYSIDLHNSALDGWSINLVHVKLFEIYARLREGRALPEPDGQDHMRHFVGLERRSLSSPADREFWIGMLEGARPTEVPGRLPVGAAPYAVEMHDVAISRELSGRIRALAERLAVPVKNVLLAAHVKVLGELAGERDVLTGYEHAGRPELEGAQDAIGMFLNTVPFRLRLAGGPWADLVRQVNRAEVELLPRRRYPMARVKFDVGARAPLFESVFNFTHFYLLKQLRQGPEFSLLDVQAWAETEFVLRAEFSQHFFTDEVCLYLQYHANVFDSARIAQIGEYYRAALEAMTTDPSAAHDTRPLTVDVPAGAPARSAPAPDPVAAAPAVTERNRDVAVERRIAAAWAEVLGSVADQIGPADDFFALGGHSLSALRVVLKLGGLISLTDLTLHSTLGALAAVAVSNTRAARRLLRPLVSMAEEATGTLVCLPYAAGNAVNFRPLALSVAARNPSIATLGVELPGHDPQADEPFLPVRATAALIADELADSVRGPIVLWGHCGGAAVAVELARLLEAAGADLRNVILGAKLLPTEEEMAEAIEELGRSTDADVIRWMVSESGYTELDGLDPDHARHIARSFRHDVEGGHRYFLDVCARLDEHALATSITCVGAADDPLMGDYRQTHLRWGLITDDLRLRYLDGGGHYFIRTWADRAAALVAEIFATTPLITVKG